MKWTMKYEPLCGKKETETESNNEDSTSLRAKPNKDESFLAAPALFYHSISQTRKQLTETIPKFNKFGEQHNR